MKWKIFSFLIALTFVLAACQADNGNNGNQEGMGDGDTNVENTRFNPDNTNNDGNNANNNRDNNQYELADEAAEKIADQVDGVEDAYVLKTDNNAYVAAQMDNNNGNKDGNKNDNDNGNVSENDNGNINDDDNGNNVDMDGEMNGQNYGNMNGNKRNNTRNNGVDDNGIDGNKNNRGFGMNGNEGNTDANTNGLNGNNNKEMTNNFSNTRDNNNGDELTDDVKKQISKIVKSVDSDVDNVYVSTNPDFFDLTNNYADDAGNGKPVRGLFNQMGNMIERIFPQNKG